MGFRYTLDPGLEQGLELDVAVIGAGIAGLYAGWRLRSGEPKAGAADGKPPSVHIFELGDRVGGRLVTAFLDGMPHVRCELGGMRYIKGTPSGDNPLPGHQMVERLSAKLGLTSIPFPMGDQNGMYYARRRRFRVADVKAGFLLPYGLDAWEQRKTDDDLFGAIVEDILDRAGVGRPKTRQEWNAVKEKLNIRGRPAHKLGFWNALSDYVTSEGYLFLQDANGYDSNTINWNAGEAIQAQIGDFGASTTYETFQEGYDGLAHRTAEYFCRAGGKIWSENGLVSFSREQRDGETFLKLQIFNKANKTYWTVHARRLVLALPRRSLELLDQTNFFFNDRLKAHRERLLPLIQSVIIQPAFKLYLGYPRPWWREFTPRFASGRTITDLPARQIYYFGTEEEQPGGERGNSNSLLMASYTDEWASDYWRPLEEDESWEPSQEALSMAGTASSRPPPGFAGMRRGGTGFIPRQAPALMVEQVQKQIREIHGGQIAIPEPYVSAFYDWGDDPYGGGYHAWAGGSRVPAPWDVAKRMRKPFDDVPVHICGEAYSDQQAWVEGSLCDAELMLQEHFGMACPDWLPSNYYLGW